MNPAVLAFPKPVTESFLVALATTNPEYRFETTADGKLVIGLLTGTFAAAAEAELIAQIAIWNKRGNFGRVTSSSGGLTLSDGAVKGPDAAFISQRRLAALSPRRKKRAFEKIAPDAVFELLSPSDSVTYTHSKCLEYVATGSGVAVLLNPEERTVTFYRADVAPSIDGVDVPIVVGDEMPGFELDAAAVFAAGEWID